MSTYLALAPRSVRLYVTVYLPTSPHGVNRLRAVKLLLYMT